MVNRVRAGLLALAVAVLSACGGGGGLNINVKIIDEKTPPQPTTATKITVLDGYIQGAIVCVDKNKNGSCDAGETQGKTGADGKVTLDIPVDDVGKYPIVAYIPADAMDSDNPKVPVGKSYTMSAPADQSAIVSPLSTLVQHLVDKGGKTTADANLQISTAVGDPRIDYIQSNNAQARMAAKMLAKLMQDPAGLAITSNLSEPEKQAAIKDALIAKLADIQSKARALVAPGAACAIDMTAQSCHSAIEPAIVSLLVSSNPGTPQAVVSQTASITMASAGDLSLNSGDRTDSLRPTLSGSYSDALGRDYSVRVLDDSTDLGAAMVTESSKTWTFTPAANLSPGSHSFTAVVVRNSDGIKGTVSSAYTIKLGNSVGANSGFNVLDTITLTLSNLWSNVKSVVFDIPNTPSDARITSDLVDGQTSKTVNAPDSGFWSSITTAFKTVGNKVISVVFKDGADGTGNTLDTRSITVGVGQGSVTQKASISKVQDDSSGSAVTVDDGKATKDTTPVISGSIDTALSTDMSPFYDVVIYDNGAALTGTLAYTDPSNKKDWTFTPGSTLSQGAHAFTAKVVRFDGTLGEASAPRSAIILTARPSVSPPNPNVLDMVTFSVSNLYSGISTVTWALDDGSTVQTSTVTNGATSITTSYSTQGNKNVIVGYRNASGQAIATDSLTVTVAEGTVSQTASITGASGGSTPVSNGGRTDSVALTLSGSYSGDALGNDYIISVRDGNIDLDTAYLQFDDSRKTWTFNTGTLTPGSHDFKAVVVRKGDRKLGTVSSTYTVNIGNSVSVSSSGSGTNVLDTITLTLSNLWSNVKSVVFSFTGDTSDLVDAQKANQTVNAPASDTSPWSSITTAFKTVGNKVISVVFKDGTNGAGTTLDTRSVSVTVGQGSVTQKASISNVQDDSSGSAVTVDDGRFTKDTTPIISGTVDVALDEYYEVAVYDNGSKLTGTLTYTNNKKDWRFTPSTALTQGLHAFTASVIRFDGLEGTQSSPARQAIILTARPSFSPTNPNVLDTVTFSLSNLYSGISTVTWALDDGRAVQTSTVTDGATSISTRYGTQGDKTVTVGYRNASGLAIATDSLTVTVGEGTVSQTASITGASAGGTTISDGGRTDSLTLTLSGSYGGNALGTDYSIRVLDNGRSVGTATLAADAGLKTWSLTSGTLTAGSHDFKAVVVRNIDGKLGTASSAYTVNLGNSVNAGTSSNVLDTITLTLSNIWSNVKSVVFGIPNTPSDSRIVGDLVDGQTSKTVTASDNGVWSSITTAFKTVGSKIINLVFKDGTNGTGNTLDTRSITLDVGLGSVGQIATIREIQDDSSITPVVVQEGATTNDTTPIISGTVDEGLSQYYDVAVYDNGVQLTGRMSYTNNRKDWSFTPDTTLLEGPHALTAKVVRMDRVVGTGPTTTRTLIVSLPKYKLVPKSDGTNFDITECVKDVSTGLTWEGKTSTGQRAGQNSYTNYTSTTIPQKEAGGLLSQTEIETFSNSIGYVKYVNNSSLCGFNNWRLPTLAELKTLVKVGVNPSMDPTWFPNTSGYFYWASDSDIQLDGFDAGAAIRISDGKDSYAFRFDKDRIRLVRTAPSVDVVSTPANVNGVSQIAWITSVKDGNTPLQNGDTASSRSLTLQGSYQGTLDPGYSVEVIVDGMDWDSAYIDPVNKTWTSTKTMPSFGSLKIQAVVKRYEQIGPWRGIGGNEYFGSYSDVFNVKIGNKVTQNSSQLSTWDEWVLNLSNLWRNVRSAVITFVADASDLVDGLVKRTLSGFDPIYMQPRGQSLSISAGFKTTGDKAVNIAYLDGNGQTVSTDSVQLSVTAAGSVTQIPTIDAIKSIANQPIEKNATSRETVLSVDGSLSAAIGKFYFVEVYDNGSNTAIAGTMRYNENRTKWTFSPSAPLAIGSHALTAAVVRGDGVSGARTANAWNFTLTQPRLIKIGADGTALANQNAKWSDTGNEAEGTRWDCILESDTGRMWEVKPKTPNQLRSSDATFTYYVPSPKIAGSWVGSATTSGSCSGLPSGKNCNTQNYVEAINSVGLCGKKDWRLPLQSDVDQQLNGFSKLYFPTLTWFWEESDTPSYGWYVEAYSTVNVQVGPFTYGDNDPSSAVPVILVSGSPVSGSNVNPVANTNAILPPSPQPSLAPVASTATILAAYSLGAYASPTRMVLGNYSGDFVAADYNLIVMLNGADVGTASLGQPGNWSFIASNLAKGNHVLNVVVERKSDRVRGKPSAGYAISVL